MWKSVTHTVLWTVTMTYSYTTCSKSDSTSAEPSRGDVTGTRYTSSSTFYHYGKQVTKSSGDLRVNPPYLPLNPYGTMEGKGSLDPSLAPSNKSRTYNSGKPPGWYLPVLKPKANTQLREGWEHGEFDQTGVNYLHSALMVSAGVWRFEITGSPIFVSVYPNLL